MAGETALCLSGGGYRAAIFHLGAMLRLHERDELADVDLFSAVSGGSIALAWLASRYLAGRDGPEEAFDEWCGRCDFRVEVLEPFRAVTSRDLRSFAVFATLPWNWLWPSARVRLLERGYRRFLGDLRLRELPEAPGFVFCATDLSFGCNFEFSRRRVGDFQAGYLRDPGAIAVATAVAASSSFPPLFGPVRLPVGAVDFTGGKQSGSELLDRIELSDGGVYDNMATEPALKRCARILVSDAGAPFAFDAGSITSAGCCATPRWSAARRWRCASACSTPVAPAASSRAPTGTSAPSATLAPTDTASACARTCWRACAPTWTASPTPNSKSWSTTATFPAKRAWTRPAWPMPMCRPRSGPFPTGPGSRRSAGRFATRTGVSCTRVGGRIEALSGAGIRAGGRVDVDHPDGR